MLSPRGNTSSLEVAKCRAIKAAIWRRSGREKILSAQLNVRLFSEAGFFLFCDAVAVWTERC